MLRSNWGGQAILETGREGGWGGGAWWVGVWGEGRVFYLIASQIRLQLIHSSWLEHELMSGSCAAIASFAHTTFNPLTVWLVIFSCLPSFPCSVLFNHFSIFHHFHNKYSSNKSNTWALKMLFTLLLILHNIEYILSIIMLLSLFASFSG